MKRWLSQIHEAFIAHVRDRRGTSLADDTDLFTGDVWVGRTAEEKGLADGIGHLVPFMKDRFGKKVKFRRYSVRRSLFGRLGVQLFGDAIGQIEDRAAFARSGCDT